jgi:peptide/nickel transport system permease protein
VISFVLRRAFWAVWLFLVATLGTYVIFFLIPGSPVHMHPAVGEAGRNARIAGQLHLDVPVYQQYWIYLWNIVRHQSFGYSYWHGTSVRWIIGQDAPVTGSLIVGSLLIWLAIAIPVGILAGLRPRSLLDRGAMVFVLIGVSVPTVWLGRMLAYGFGYRLGWAPIADYCNFFPQGAATCSGPARWAYHLLLPWLTFTLLFAAMYVRMIRSTVTETATEDYIRTAWAKGASPTRVAVHHVLRNSLLPVVTMLGMDISLALSGAVVVEVVFNLHGLGWELLDRTRADDVPVVVGIILFITLAVIVWNFIVDVAYAWLDPRIRPG